MKGCNGIQKLLSRLVDNEHLSSYEKSCIQEHIETCKECEKVYSFNIRLRDNMNIRYYPENSIELVNRINYQIQNHEVRQDIMYSFVRRLTFVPVSLVIIFMVIWVLNFQINDISIGDNYYLAEFTDLENIVLESEITKESVLQIVMDETLIGGS